MRIFLKKSFISFVLVFTTINLISFSSLLILKRSCFYKPSFLVNKFQSTESFDYIILGSSRGLTTLDTKQIDDTLHTNGINLSMDDTGIGSHYLMLQHFYKTGHSTKLVVLNIDPWNALKSNSSLNKNDYRFLPFINKDYVKDYYSTKENDFFGVFTLAQVLPVFAVAQYNLEIFFISIYALINKGQRNRFDERGNYSYPENAFSKREGNDPYEIELEFINKDIRLIRNFCDQRNIKLVFYVSPIYQGKVIKNTLVHKETLINDIYLLNSDSTFFYDQIHVNFKGRKIVTQHFAQKLNQLLN